MTVKPEEISGHTGLEIPENFVDTLDLKPQRNFVDTLHLKTRRKFVDTLYAAQKVIMALAIEPNSIVFIPLFS